MLLETYSGWLEVMLLLDCKTCLQRERLALNYMLIRKVSSSSEHSGQISLGINAEELNICLQRSFLGTSHSPVLMCA